MLSAIAPDAALATGTATGTDEPTNTAFLDPGDVLDARAAAGPYGSLLSAFIGPGPNGTWN